MAGKLALAVLAFAACGCAIDERTIVARSDSTVIGSFESGNDGTRQADDARFGAWSSYSYGATLPLVTSSIAWLDEPTGCQNSNWCLRLDWQLGDASAGAPGVAGVGDRIAPLRPIDLSDLSRIVFSHRYMLPGAVCQTPSALNVIVQCDGLQAAYRASTSLSGSWTTSTIAFSAMAEMDGAPPRGVALASCLAATTAILFQIEVSLASGACTSGTFALDTVSLR